MAKRALVVGINDYSARGYGNLKWSVADANSMSQLLVHGFGFDPSEVYLMTDKKASRANILQTLRYILSQAQPGDVACFYFSGHGGLVAADETANCSVFYETICPASGADICDHELAEITDLLQPSVCNFTVILDACHSGGVHETDPAQFKCKSAPLSGTLLSQLLASMRTLVPVGICLPFDGLAAITGNVCNVRVGSNGCQIDLDEEIDKILVPQAKSTLLSACRFQELAHESSTSKHSLLTQSILELVNQCDFRSNHTDLLDRVRPRTDALSMQEFKRHQSPQLRGQANRMSEDFLGGWRDCR